MFLAARSIYLAFYILCTAVAAAATTTNDDNVLQNNCIACYQLTRFTGCLQCIVLCDKKPFRFHVGNKMHNIFKTSQQKKKLILKKLSADRPMMTSYFAEDHFVFVLTFCYDDNIFTFFSVPKERNRETHKKKTIKILCHHTFYFTVRND